MPLISPLLAPALRRGLPAIAAAILFAVFSLVHQVWFRPAAARYAKAVREATELGMPLDPDHTPRLVPPRLFALVSQNSLPAREVQDAATSGNLTAEFLGDITRLVTRQGLQVLSTEPGPMTQDARSAQVRAHLRVRCRYPDLVALFDDLGRERRLIAVDRFTVMPDPGSTVTVEMWVSRLVLKSGVRP